MTAWDTPALPERIVLGPGAGSAYPAFVDEGASVGVRLFSNIDDAQRAMRLGLRRLALFELAAPIAHHLSYHPAWPEIESHWSMRALPSSPLDRIAGVVAEHAVLAEPMPRSADTFDSRLADAASQLHASADRIVVLSLRLLRALAAIDAGLKAPIPSDWMEAAESIRDHVRSMSEPLPFEQSIEELALTVESLEASLARWQRLPRGGVQRDRAASNAIAVWAHRAAAARAAHPPGSPRHGSSERFRQEVERLRIRLFTIGPEVPATVERRLLAAWAELA